MQCPIWVNGRIVETIKLNPLRVRWERVNSQVYAGRIGLIRRYGQRMIGPRIAELLREREELMMEATAMRWCRDQRRADLPQATAAEKVQIRRRMRFYMDRMRELWDRTARVDDQIYTIHNSFGYCREILGAI